MSFVSHLSGLASGASYPADKLMNLDPIDGRPVTMQLDLEALDLAFPNSSWYQPQRRDMWRFGGLLPLDINDSDDRKHIATLGEGFTPLLNASELTVAKKSKLKLWIKEEGNHHDTFGGNPTLSFKDRGMAVVASMAKKFGIKSVAVPTQGNAGDSLCRYARSAGIDIVVAMPETTPAPIQNNIATMAKIDAGVKLELVNGSIREAGELLKKLYLPKGYFNCATFQEPGWRIEGKKTLGLEIAEALGNYKEWLLPDAIVYPTGGGTGILGMAKAFDELQALGLIGAERPRIYSVQSVATDPIVKAIEQGDDDTTPQKGGHTSAVGLNVPGGVGHFEVLNIIRKTQGSAIRVSEDQMRSAFKEQWQTYAWKLCPEGAMALAALPLLLDIGELRANETVVVVNTGSYEKYFDDVSQFVG